MTDEPEWSKDEWKVLAEVRRELPPPPHVEESLLAALRGRGLIRPRAARRRWLAAAAALALAFGAGMATQRFAGRSRLQAPPRARFLLLLYGGNGEGRHREYADWARAVSERGLDLHGEELGREESQVPAPAWPSAGPVTPRGFFTVSARTVEEAREVASSCPHLWYGGSIVIKPIVVAP